MIAKMIVHAATHADTVVVVDDGSRDDTGVIAKALGAVVVTHDKNLGKGAAISDCFKFAKITGADVLVTIDADGQHDPSQIPTLVRALLGKEADVAIGSRSSRPFDMPKHRWLGKRAIDRATLVKVGERVVDTQSGFRAYSRRAIENLVVGEYGIGAETEILMQAHRAGMHIIELPTNIRYAGLKTSSQNAMIHASDVLFSIVKFVSIRHQLTFYGGFGVAAMLVSIFFGVMTLNYYQQWGRVVTNLALISVAAGIVGILSIFTGIILFSVTTVAHERS